MLIGDVLAYRGRFRDAARIYQKAGQEHKALTMYTDLRMFDLAQVSCYEEAFFFVNIYFN